MTSIEKRIARIEFNTEAILRLLALNFHFQGKIMQALDALQAAVAAEDTVIDSAVALINGIPALIAGVDPAALAALQADITAKATALAAAVTANTPAA